MLSFVETGVIALIAALVGAFLGVLYQGRIGRKREEEAERTNQQLQRENQKLRQEKPRPASTPRENKPAQPAPGRAGTKVAARDGYPPAPAAPPAAANKPRPVTAIVPPAATAAPRPVAASVPPPATANTAPAAVPAVPTCLYASAVAGGFLRADQLSAQSMHRMQLVVYPDAQQPDRASFALSPGVDTNWLLEAGLDRLRDYFDYVPPAGKPTAVADAGPGWLRREGESWQVQQKAQLHVQ